MTSYDVIGEQKDWGTGIANLGRNGGGGETIFTRLTCPRLIRVQAVGVQECQRTTGESKKKMQLLNNLIYTSLS